VFKLFRISSVAAAALGAMIIALTSVSVAVASPAPPNGTNLGIRFVGYTSNPLDANAVFLQSDGSTLVPCGPANAGCHFDFTYKINGSTDQEAILDPQSTSYDTWPTITQANINDEFCWGGSNSQGQMAQTITGPLTNFNCFNQDGFGQMFRPTVSGTLSDFTMAMACLSPTNSTSITALLFEVTNDGSNDILSTQVATSQFTLNNCSTTWSAHTFTNNDFVYPAINFGSIQLNSSTSYAVLFTGEAVAGVAPVGVATQIVAPAAAPEPALASTGADGTSLSSLIGLALLSLGLLGIIASHQVNRKIASNK
jgi:hypothetical protein